MSQQPDDPATTGFAYLLEASNHLFKLGRSFDPSKRNAKFQTLPVTVRLVHKIESSDAKWLERTLHHRYAAKRIRGEWFALTDDDVAEIVKLHRLDPPEQQDLFGSEIGHKLTELREERGMSVHELAHKAGLPASVVSLLEKGKEKDPRISVLQAPARALNASLHELAG